MDFNQPANNYDLTNDPGGNLDFNSDSQQDFTDTGGDTNFFPTPDTLPRPKAIADSKAVRAHYALGQESPGLETLQNSMQTDEGEQALRTDLAAQEDHKHNILKQQLVQEAAIRAGGNINLDQANLLSGILNLTIKNDPNTFLEKKFASQYTSDVLTSNDSPNSPTVQATPAQLNIAQDTMHNTATMVEIGRKRAEELKKAQEDQGWLGWTVDLGETFIPLLSGYRLYFPDARGLPGTAQNLEERLQYIWSLPTEEADAQSKVDLDYLLSHNLRDAAYYVQAFFGMSRSQQLDYNLSSALNVAPLVGAAAKNAGKLAGVVKGAITGISEEPIKLKNVYSANGDVGKAAVAGATEKAKQVLTIRDPALHGLDLSDDIPLIVNPSPTIKLNPGALATEAQNRIITVLEQNARKGAEVAFNMNRIDRVPPETVQVMAQNALRDFEDQYKLLEDGIIQWDIIPAETNAGNVNFLKVTIGKRDGTLFKSEEAANTYAERQYGLNLERYTTGKGGVAPRPPQETIKSSAIQYKGKIYTGRLHIDAGESAAKATGDSQHDVFKNHVAGFLTSIGRFVKREEADRIASAAKQIREETPTIGGKLDALQLKPGKGDNGGPPLEEDINTVPPATVKQQGNGWYIQITKPLSEVDPLARESVAIPTTNQEPISPANMVLGALRGAREVLPEFQNANRAVTTYVPNQMRRLIKDMVQPIGKLSRKSYNQLMNVLEENKNFVDADGNRGRRFYSQGALEQTWRALNGRLPTEKESLAYWTYHQVMEMDLAMRDINMYRDLSRLGIEHLQIPIRGTEEELGVPVMSQPFYSVFRRELPWKDKKDWSVWVEDGANSKLYYKSMGDEAKSHLEKMIRDEGAQVFQIPNPADRPLRDIIQDGRLVNFVVTKRGQTKPLPMRLVDKNDGVHVIYPHPFKVVQPKIQKADRGNWDHFGDQTITLNMREKDAAATAKVYEQVRQMIKNQVPESRIVDFIERNITQDPKKLIAEFSKDGRLNPDVPITHTRMNVSGLDHNPGAYKQFENIEDHTKSPLNLFGQVDTSFLQERDLPGVQGRIVKSGDSPIVQVEKATTINPIAALQKGLTNAMRGMMMNDMKASAIEQWISQHSHLLADPDLAQKNPLYAFYNMAFNEGAPRNEILKARWTRGRIRQFIGQQTDVGKAARYMEEKLFNSLPHGIAKWYAVHDYPLVRDPSSYARSAMVHSFFGLLNPLQYWVQVQALFHGMFVAGPKNGMAGTTFTALQRMGLQFTEHPAILDHYASISSKANLGYTKPEWFKEAYDFIRKHGADIISNEYALRSDLADAKVLTSAARKVLDMGLGPFKEGTRQARMNAFNIAYIEWRKANPTAVLDRAAERQILNRANTFDNNMTRAGNSALEEGWASFPLQFTTWNRRLIDQVWGQELTRAEKARVLIGHSALYGIPMGVGVAVPLALYDRTRKAMIEDGRDVASPANRLMLDGVLGTATSWALGKDYDFSRRWGPSNTQAVEDLFFGDKELWKTLTGPLGSFTGSVFKAAFPFLANGYIAVTGGQQHFNLTKEDILDVAKQTTVGSNLWKSYMLINFQKYMSRNERFLATSEEPWRDALILTLFGAIPQQWRDMQLRMQDVKDIEAYQRSMQQNAILEYQRAYRALANDDPEGAERHTANAKVYMEVFGDLRDGQIVETIKKSKEGLIAGEYERAKVNYSMRGYKKGLAARMQRLFDLP